MTLTLTGVKTAPDAWDFTVANLLPAESPTFQISYGDGTAPVTVNTNASGSTTVHHVYTVVGHHDYTVTVTANKTPLASTLAQLSSLGAAQTPQSMFPQTAPTTPGGDAANYNLGIEFTVKRAGRLTAIKFCKSTIGTATTRKVQLWDSASMAAPGSRLYEWTTSNETASGWQTFTLPTPIDLVAGKTYVVSWQTADYLPYLTPIPARNTNIDVQYTRFTYTAWPSPPSTTYLTNYSALVDVVFVPFGALKADESMFSAVSAPSGGAVDYEIGQQFTPLKAGVVRSVKFWRHASSTGTGRTVNVWDVATQAKLASAATTGESGSGWRTVPLAAQLPVQVGKKYQVSWGTAGYMAYKGAPYPTPAAPSLTDNGSYYASPAGAFPGNVLTPVPTYGMTDLVFAAEQTLADLAALPSWPTLGSWAATTQTASMLAAVDVGPATIWATVKAGDPIPVVQVDTYLSSGQNVVSWEISRDSPGASTTIYVGAAWQTAVSFVDMLAPLGVPVTYRLHITYADYTSVLVSSNTVTITGTTGCYVTDPNTGDTLRVTLVTWPEREHDARRAVLGVLGRADPVALSDRHMTPAGDWTFYTTTDADTQALTALLTASTFATLRTQPDSSIATVTVSVGNVAERRYSDRGGDARRFIDAEVQEIEPLPATALPLNATLGGLATVDGDTLGELSQLRDTLLQLSMVETGPGQLVEAGHAFNV